MNTTPYLATFTLLSFIRQKEHNECTLLTEQGCITNSLTFDWHMLVLLNLPDGIQNLSISSFPGPVLYVEVRQTVLLAPLLALYQGLPVQD